MGIILGDVGVRNQGFEVCTNIVALNLVRALAPDYILVHRCMAFMAAVTYSQT